MKKMLMPVLAAISLFKGPGAVSIPSCVVTSPLEHETWSKRDMQRMKGKAARKNRGRNRRKHD